MSLFPAYPGTSQEPINQPGKDQEWLNNSSYGMKAPSKRAKKKKKEEVIPIDDSPGTRKLERKLLKKRMNRVKWKQRMKEKKKAKKMEKQKQQERENYHRPVKEGDKRKEEVELNETLNEDVDFTSDDFFPADKNQTSDKIKVESLYTIDKHRQLSYITAVTISKFSRPRFFSRAFGVDPSNTIPKKEKKLKKVKLKRYFNLNDQFEGCKEGNKKEQEMVMEKTKSFNKKLAEDPHDIETWIEFVKFQDEFYKYQHLRFKSWEGRIRAADHHKLSILDRAVTENPDNRELQTMWLKIGASILPSEEMSSRIDKILEDSGGTIILWLGLMTTTQHSLARCTVPSVTKLYEKLLLNFQKVKQPDHGRDLHVLELIFHYGRFLDHCGHWEILWMIIKVNLQFNTKIDLTLDLKVDDKVKKLEDEVLQKEKQAIWQMWSKMERIREGLHFLPDSNSIGYFQRHVSPESYVNFTWHFHPDLHFQLIVSFIMLLKVPLLPLTDTALKFFMPDALPWAFDSPEFVLSSVLISPAVNLRNGYLSPVTQLSRGPQYLRKLNGQIEFFKTVDHVLETCFKCLEGRQRTALGVWWLRFERWIQLLGELRLAFLPDERKTAKTFFKDFLKVEENRNNLLFYIEYGLLEFNRGNTDLCIQILKTLITSRQPVLNLGNEEEKAAATSAYRTLCEVLIRVNKRNEAMDLLINLGSGNPPEEKVTIHSLAAAEKKFEHISIELIHGLDESSGSFSSEDLMTPTFVVDWISCYFWLIALVKSPSQLRESYKKILELIETKTGVLVDHVREGLWENIITVFWVFEKYNVLHLKEVLRECCRKFPHNLTFLSLMADADLHHNTYWWSLNKTFLTSPTVFSCVFLICIALDRFGKDSEGFQNRMTNLFQNLALREGKLSSMVHCLRLRFLFENDNLKLNEAHLQAIESCPWNKSVYMESILLLPAKLMQLTDVLIEKEMRIHITPDEIQEMRD